jgi:hypothetical protein
MSRNSLRLCGPLSPRARPEALSSWTWSSYASSNEHCAVGCGKDFRLLRSTIPKPGKVSCQSPSKKKYRLGSWRTSQVPHRQFNNIIRDGLLRTYWSNLPTRSNASPPLFANCNCPFSPEHIFTKQPTRILQWYISWTHQTRKVGYIIYYYIIYWCTEDVRMLLYCAISN